MLSIGGVLEPSAWGTHESGGPICLGGEYGRASGLETQLLGAPSVSGVRLSGLLGL